MELVILFYFLAKNNKLALSNIKDACSSRIGINHENYKMETYMFVSFDCNGSNNNKKN